MAHDVKVDYDRAKKDLRNLIGFLECELEKESENLDLGYVEDINHIKDNLTETLISTTVFRQKILKIACNK